MRSFPIFLLACAGLLAAGGCGGTSGEKASSGSSSGSASGTGSASKYDSGPRAADEPVDAAAAATGERLFKDKGCSACHAFGQKLTGPDLAGVARRRTAKWIEQQILHPDIMTKEDPVSHQLLAEFMLQMPNQGLTSEEARAVIEYFKHKDQESTASHE